MKYYLRGIITASLIAALLMTGGCKKTDPTPETEVNVPTKSASETEKQEESNVNESPSEPESSTPEENEPAELANQYTYTLTKESVSEAGVYTIDYPSITGLSGELIQDYINQSLKNAAMSMLLPDVNVENPLVVTYEVKRSDEKYLSVLYKGLLTWENGSIEIWNPVTLDIPSSNLILTENLVKSDLKSRTSFNEIFSKKALEKGFEFEAPEEWMGMYFTETGIVFYFMENDYSTEYTQIELPFSEIEAYINLDFGMTPAS